jgi:hypothetical protein
MNPDDAVLPSLLERCRRDHLAWINGDSHGYELPDESATNLGGVGGYTIGAAEATPGQDRVAAQFESGTGTVELINGGCAGGVAWLVMIERGTVQFEGHEAPRHWDLRVTEVFERRGDEWVRVHRHADPLIERQSVDEILTLLD